MNSENIMGIDILAEIGRNIRRIRTARRMTQSDLAAAMGTQKSYVSSLEHGRKDVQISTIKSICVALNIAPSTLFRVRAGDKEDGGRNAEAKTPANDGRGKKTKKGRGAA